MRLLPAGTLQLSDDAPHHTLSLHYWRAGAWRNLPFEGDDGKFAARSVTVLQNVKASFTLQREGEHFTYALSFEGIQPTRLQLRLSLPAAKDCFHIQPGVLFGDNNLGGAEEGHFPNLTAKHGSSVSCSPYWELRADRASHPVSLICFDGGLAAISIAPYSDGKPASDPDHVSPTDAFIRNGLFSQIAHADEQHACGVTLGYGNLPRTFLNKDQWGGTTEHFTLNTSATGRIFIEHADDRRAAHAAIRKVYDDGRDTPESPLSLRDTAAALTDAMLNINWFDEHGRNAVGTEAAKMSPFHGGKVPRENFTNMDSRDADRKQLKPWRTLADIGWTGGGVTGYPMLIAGHLLGDTLAVERAKHALDHVAAAYKPESGLLWDVNGKHEGHRVNGWWAGYIVQDVHCAYTNGSAVYYLLKSYLFARDTMQTEQSGWLDTATKVLNTSAKLQLPDGNYGYAYSTEQPKVVDDKGFAGVWFAAAMAELYQITGDAKQLESAKRGIEYYYTFVRQLNCWGAPMDTWKSNDQEGNLGFIRAARLLHEITGDERYLRMLIDSAHYEYLWRVGFRARPQVPPLKDSPWNSCGGSITSVSNPHIHPMGVYISRDLAYLASVTGDSYHAHRCEDGLNWARNCVALYPEHSRYGSLGVLTERFCPSDGLLVEKFPDGSPSSLWFSYNGWAAAACFEGVVESLMEGAK